MNACACKNHSYATKSGLPADYHTHLFRFSGDRTTFEFFLSQLVVHKLWLKINTFVRYEIFPVKARKISSKSISESRQNDKSEYSCTSFDAYTIK